MSDNPFKSQPADPTPYAAPTPAGPTPPPAAPGALTPILVFCLIFGIFGLMGSCLGGVGIASMSLAANLIENSPIPAEQKAFNRINIGAQQGAMLPNIVLLGVNLIVATMLIIGAIGCFQRKESSRSFLRTALLAAIIYSVLKLLVTVYVYFSANSAVQRAIDKLKDDPMYQDIQAQYTQTQLITMITIVVSVVIAIAIFGFYLWARSYLNKSQVIQHFADVANYKRSF